MNRPIENEYVLGKIYGLADDIKDTPTTEPCDDAISREWLMKEAVVKFYTTNYFSHITEMIENAPSVALSRPSGEWIDENNNIVPLDEYGCPRGWCKCSKCGDYLSASEEYSVRGFFCPNCGAQMKGADDD